MSDPYEMRFARGEADLRAAQALRHRAFFGREGLDTDAQDASCEHLLLWQGEVLQGCCRLRHFAPGGGVNLSYSAQFYDLTLLSGRPGPMTELGRLCLHPGLKDPDALRRLWAGLATRVQQVGSTMIFGCSSFAGCDPAPFQPALAELGRSCLAPPAWSPGKKAAEWLALPRDAPPPGRARWPRPCRRCCGAIWRLAGGCRIMR